jgi:glycosyltransferase involved in cell wall biosynthesis/SAM-dependent methyltransferase
MPGLDPVPGFHHVPLVKCRNCGMIFCGEIPSDESLKAYYGKYPTDQEMPSLISKRYNELFDKFEPYRKTNNILDFGCGNGFLLDEAKKRGWNVYGTEFDSRYVENCRKKGIHMFQVPVTADDFRGVEFDVITCIEVIEHLVRPAEEVELFYSLLRNEGLLYITTPNFNAFSLKVAGGDWSVVTYPEHLSYFTSKTLTYLCGLNSLKPLAVESSGVSIERLSVAMKTKISRYFKWREKVAEIDIHEDQKFSEFMEKFFLLRFFKKQFNNVLSWSETGDTLKAYFVKKEKPTYPKISIVTPSFNQGEFIEDTILSVLNQNYPNLEYLIIDGGSKDGTLDIIRKYESRVSYWISEPDNGQSQAINKGLTRATGEIVSWLCSDDILLPGALFKVSQCFAENKQAGLIHGKTILFNLDKKEIIKGAEAEDLPLRYLAYIPFPQPSSFFLRRILLEQGYLEEDLHYGMDYDLLIKIALNYPIHPVDDILSKYRLHAKSKSMSQLPGFAKDWVVVFSKCARTIKLSETRTNQLRKLGLYDEGTDFYETAATFTEVEKDRVMIYFLEYQLHIYYEILQLPLCAQIATVIREIDPVLYSQRSIDNIRFKSSNLPAGLIKVFRKIKRIV